MEPLHSLCRFTFLNFSLCMRVIKLKRHQFIHSFFIYSLIINFIYHKNLKPLHNRTKITKMENGTPRTSFIYKLKWQHALNATIRILQTTVLIISHHEHIIILSRFGVACQISFSGVGQIFSHFIYMEANSMKV